MSSRPVPFGSDNFTLADLAAGVTKTVSSRHGYGFQIVADPRNRGAYPLKLRLLGPDNQQSDILYVTSPQWHKGEVAKIEVEALTANPVGDWIVNVAQDERAMIFPSTPPPNPATDFPSASGGAGSGTLVTATEVQALTRADPNSDAPTSTEYLSAVGVSSFWAFVAAAVGATVTAGNLDIYRYDSTLAVWVLVLSVGLPTGTRYAGIPLDVTLLQSGRLFAAMNGVVFSDAAATGTMYMRGM